MYDYGISVNWLHVVVAAAASMGLGFLWYSPMLFGKQWSELMGWGPMTPEKMAEMKKKAQPMYAMAGVMALVTSYVLARTIASTRVYGASDAVKLAFWLWLGFVATVTYGENMWSGKPKKLWVLNAGFHLVSLGLMAAILAGWR